METTVGHLTNTEGQTDLSVTAGLTSEPLKSVPLEATTAIHVGVGADDGSFDAILGGVIAAVIVVLLLLIIVVLRYMYRHKGTYHTNEAKGTEFAETADVALKSDPALQEAVDDSKKEYFI
ncbi:glycophorin-C-like [Megalops cyprinoides]|uniref:glycophorin-C-like n=1 Tax=Megalops cyprinoides TaxID=118141 RepID=UPI001863CA48|nr:glycophorin-C-like [Megalops cyprinoides]